MEIGQKLSNREFYELMAPSYRSKKPRAKMDVPKTIAEIRKNLGEQKLTEKQRNADQQADQVRRWSSRVKMALTLQTKLIVKRDNHRQDQQWIDLQEDFHRFSSRLNYRLFGNLNRRKPQRYSLLMIPIIEGRRFSPEGERTLHYHVAIGNLPPEIPLLRFRDLVYAEWATTKFGKMDIELLPADTGWLNYITKESRTGNIECVDWRNMSTPRHVLSV